MNQSLLVSRPRLVPQAGTSRVVAGVDGTDVWFESSEAALRPAVEAFTSASLVPAAVLERQLVVDGPVAADFAAGVPRILEILRDWWDCSRVLPSLDIRAAAEGHVDSNRAPATTPRGTALCFSGGVDSFYTLLAAGRQVDALVFVHGFDIELADESRSAAVEEHLRTVAAAAGARPVFIRTNLRSHPAYRATNWSQTHGGALAAIGHLLADHWSTLLISSAYSLDDPHPCGSHWELDPLWGGAGLTVEHVGAECSRTAKLAALKDHPLVRRYLRVCWENRSERLNCSRCEKCIRNEVVLAALGALDSFEVFESSATLAARVDGVPAVRARSLLPRYRSALALGLPPDIDSAVRRLLARSRRAHWRARLAHTRSYAADVAWRIAHMGKLRPSTRTGKA